MPFRSPGRSVGDETLDSVAAHAPVSAVHLSEPVTSLTNGGFRDAVDARSEFEGVVIPVWSCSSAEPVTVSGRKCTDATGCYRASVVTSPIGAISSSPVRPQSGSHSSP